MARHTIVTCNMCGKELDEADRRQHFSLYQIIGYGSKYDGMGIVLDLCSNCMDELIDRCKISPLEENPPF